MGWAAVESEWRAHRCRVGCQWGIGELNTVDIVKLLVERIRIWKPGTGITKVQENPVRIGETIVYPIEDVFFVVFVVHHREFWGIKEPPTVHPFED